MAHLSPEDCINIGTNPVDGIRSPQDIFWGHFTLAQMGRSLQNNKKENIAFLIEPRIRFKDVSGEQGTFFIKDPSGNALEFKSFRDDSDVFRK